VTRIRKSLTNEALQNRFKPFHLQNSRKELFQLKDKGETIKKVLKFQLFLRIPPVNLASKTLKLPNIGLKHKKCSIK